MSDSILVCGVVRDILDKNKIYLLHHNTIGKWVVPGGHLEHNDTPEFTLEKEMFEEVGVDCTLYKLIKQGHLEFFFNGKKEKKFIHLYNILQYNGIPYNKEPNNHSLLRSFDNNEMRKMVLDGLASDHVRFYLDCVEGKDV